MNSHREFEQSKREGAVTMVETEEKSNRRSGEAVSGGWKLALTSSKLLVFAIMAGLIATVAAEISGLLPFSILKLETIAYLLFGVAALCFLAWIVLVSAGVIKKNNALRQAGTVVLSFALFIFTAIMSALILLDDGVRAGVLYLVIMACVIILPPSMFFVFLAMRKQSLLNSFIANLSRMRVLERRKDAPFQLAESEACRLCRIGSYFERFGAYYGLVNTSAIVSFVVAMKDEQEGIAQAGPDKSKEFKFFPLDGTVRMPVYAVKTVMPVILSVVPVTIGWLLVLPPRLLSVTGPEAPSSLWYTEPVIPVLSAVGFAFLGAYFFSLQMLVRRYITRDLAPNAYTQMSQRIILAIIAAWSLQYVIQLSDWKLFAVAFICGAFPVVVWQVLTQAVKKVVGSALRIPSLQTGRSVGELSGLTVWHELRLEEEDIESVEGMASADIIEMMLSTKFPPHRIIDWIDEALLRLCLPLVTGEDGRPSPHPLTDQLARYGVRTATGLVSVYYSSMRPGSANSQSLIDADTMKRLPPIITEVMLQPNFRHVADWKRLPEAIFEDLAARIAGGVIREQPQSEENLIRVTVAPTMARRSARSRRAAANGAGAPPNITGEGPVPG
jgi:hypothetical protein